MYKEHAKRILDLLQKNADRGVITAEDAPRAVATLEQEIQQSRRYGPAEDLKRDVHAHHGDEGDDPEHEEIEVISFATRAYPVLEMLRAAAAEGKDVLWGVEY